MGFRQVPFDVASSILWYVKHMSRVPPEHALRLLKIASVAGRDGEEAMRGDNKTPELSCKN